MGQGGADMMRSGIREEQMDILRRRIVAELRAGAQLSSPQVVALSRRLDRLVLAAYGQLPTKR